MTYSQATTTVLILLLVFSTLTLTATSTPPPSTHPPTPTGGCSDAVIAISPCLPFISDPPNNLSNRPSSQCCDLFAASFRANEAICLCYLIRGNRLLGFPVNATKLLSLSSLCPFFEDSRSNSLQSICAGAQELPPLMSTTGPVISIPHNFDSDNLSHPLNTTIPSSQGQSGSLPVPAAPGPTTSQKNNNANQFPPGTVIFIIPLLCFFQPTVAAYSFGNHL